VDATADIILIITTVTGANLNSILSFKAISTDGFSFDNRKKFIFTVS
jgi:hypothetical protein